MEGKQITRAQAELDSLFVEWAASVGVVMDSDADRADYAARGHLYDDPGSDVHDHPASVI